MNKRKFLKTGILKRIFGLFASKTNSDTDNYTLYLSINQDSPETRLKCIQENNLNIKYHLPNNKLNGDERDILKQCLNHCLIQIAIAKVDKIKNDGLDLGERYMKEINLLKNKYKLEKI